MDFVDGIECAMIQSCKENSGVKGIRETSMHRQLKPDLWVYVPVNDQPMSQMLHCVLIYNWGSTSTWFDTVWSHRVCLQCVSAFLQPNRTTLPEGTTFSLLMMLVIHSKPSCSPLSAESNSITISTFLDTDRDKPQSMDSLCPPKMSTSRDLGAKGRSIYSPRSADSNGTTLESLRSKLEKVGVVLPFARRRFQKTQ